MNLVIDPVSRPSAEVSASRPVTRKFALFARLLLGLVFFVFGLNGFLNFIPPPPAEQMPPALLTFMEGMLATGYLLPLVKGLELLVGLLLLANRFVPLALVLIAPIVVNIVGVHVFIAPQGLAIAFVVLALHLFLAWSHRAAFSPLLAARAVS